MYADIGLTTPVTGYAYITIGGFNIFNLDISTGVVGVDTGSACANGTAALYKLYNSTETICAQSADTYYTNGDFTVGGTLYMDSALTTPVTGYSYLAYLGISPTTPPIYNLNSVTGAIGAATGVSCS
jgi:hypothetical protein